MRQFVGAALCCDQYSTIAGVNPLLRLGRDILSQKSSKNEDGCFGIFCRRDRWSRNAITDRIYKSRIPRCRFGRRRSRELVGDPNLSVAPRIIYFLTRAQAGCRFYFSN